MSVSETWFSLAWKRKSGLGCDLARSTCKWLHAFVWIW